MKWIRWRGLVAFVIISAVVSVFWFFLIDRIIERYIEKAGTSIVGAKVELEKADLSLFPMGLTLTGLQVTDPGSPMRNAVEAERIAFLMDAVNLLMRKVTIDEMTVSGVALNTPRKSSGAVEKAAPGRQEEAPLLTFEIPDPMEVLEKEELESIKLAEELRGRISEDREKFEKALDSLPDEKRIEAYEERFERLKSKARSPAEIIAKAGDLIALRKDIENDAGLVKTLAGEVGKTAGYYRERVEFAAGAPARDVKKLTEKYALTQQGLMNLSKVFFGGQIYAWTDKALMWRERVNRVSRVYKAEPEVEVKPRGRGADVRFPERDPVPDFLIRKAFVSVNIPSGDISGEVLDITGDQHITGRPVKFRFSGTRLKGLDSMSLIGEINRVAPDMPKDFARFDLRGYRIDDFILSEGGSMPLAFRKGLADLSINLNIRDFKFDAGFRAALSGLELAAGRPDEDNPFLKAAASALSDVKGFGLNAAAQGTVDNYSLNISSDLDRVLRESAGRVIARKAAAFQAELEEEINRKVAAPLSQARGQLSSLTGIQQELDKRLRLMDRLTEEITKSIPAKGFKIPGLSF